MAKSYKIGQVLFVIPTNNPMIVPVQVIERRVSETLDGTNINHLVRVPKPNSKPKILEGIKGSVFGSLDDAKHFMIKNAESAINAMIQKAHNASVKAFGPKTIDNQFEEQEILSDSDFSDDQHDFVTPAPQPIDEVNDVAGVTEDGMTEIMLPNGEKRKVKVNMPS